MTKEELAALVREGLADAQDLAAHAALSLDLQKAPKIKRAWITLETDAERVFVSMDPTQIVSGVGPAGDSVPRVAIVAKNLDELGTKITAAAKVYAEKPATEPPPPTPHGEHA